MRPPSGCRIRRDPCCTARPPAPCPGAVARMRVFNPDGSEPEMCGNGIRMFARYLARSGAVRTGVRRGDPGRTHQTPAARRRTRARGHGLGPLPERQYRFGTASGAPVVGRRRYVDARFEADGRDYRFTFVDVGNPHCVILVDDPAASTWPESARSSSVIRCSPTASTSSSSTWRPDGSVTHAGVGARRGGDPGLRHRRDRRGSGRVCAWGWPPVRYWCTCWAAT